MATDETTESTESTESTQRGVGELLDMSTYQGMTDSEIQSLIDYWRKYGYDEGYAAHEIDAASATQSELLASANAAYEASQKAFDAAIQTQVNFMTYDGSVTASE